VVSTITSPKPRVSADSGLTPSNWIRSAPGFPKLAPEKAPAKIAINVMPVCTVEMNRPGSAASSMAHLAPPLPLLAMAFSRASRAETIANSLIESTPFSTTSARMRTTSNQGMGVGALISDKI